MDHRVKPGDDVFHITVMPGLDPGIFRVGCGLCAEPHPRFRSNIPPHKGEGYSAQNPQFFI
jgi:hypothetical protein